MDTKVCSNPDCPFEGKPQPLGNFPKIKARNDKLSARCRTCANAKRLVWRTKHPERDKATDKKYRDSHKEKIRAKNRDWRARNLDREKAHHKKWYAENKEYDQAKNRQWRHNNRARVKENLRQWHKRNPERSRLIRKIRWQAHYTRKIGLPNKYESSDWQRALDYFNGCCAVCGRPAGLWHTLAMDHWIPLSDPDCPGTIPTNIVPLCHATKGGEGGCNNSKSNKNPQEWLVEKFGKRKANQILKRIQNYFDGLKESG